MQNSARCDGRLDADWSPIAGYPWSTSRGGRAARRPTLAVCCIENQLAPPSGVPI